MRRLIKFIRLPWSTQVTLIEVGALLVAIRLGLAMLPYDRLAAIIERHAVPVSNKRRRRLAYAPSVTWAASGLAGMLIGNRPCLTQALVVTLLLKRAGREPDLKIGVSKDRADLLTAHAWVEMDGRVIIGGRHAHARYAELAPIRPPEGIAVRSMASHAEAPG